MNSGLIRAGRNVTVPPPVSTRPTGPQYVRWEDLYVSGDTMQETFNRVTPDAAGVSRIMTMPEGLFEFTGFTGGPFEGFRLGSTGAAGCRGIVGSGRDTIIRPKANTTTADKGGQIAGTQFSIQSRNNVVLSNFTMKGTPQNGLSYGGFVLTSCHDAQISGLYLQGASPGYSNFPPGETFGMNLWKSNRAVVSDCEVDGRDDNGVRVCASPIGWNSASDASVYRTYVHHGLTGMLTFWKTINIYTEDFHSYSSATGGGILSGHAINHEQSSGTVRHVRPDLQLFGRYSNVTGHTDNSATHMSFGNTVEDMPDVIVTEPIHDRGIGSTGMLMVAIHDGYNAGITGGPTNKITTMPTIVKNGVTLTPSHHPTAGYGDKNPNLFYSVIH
jgi:hypothetical protein